MKAILRKQDVKFVKSPRRLHGGMIRKDEVFEFVPSDEYKGYWGEILKPKNRIWQDYEAISTLINLKEGECHHLEKRGKWIVCDKEGNPIPFYGSRIPKTNSLWDELKLYLNNKFKSKAFEISREELFIYMTECGFTSHYSDGTIDCPTLDQYRLLLTHGGFLKTVAYSTGVYYMNKTIPKKLKSYILKKEVYKK